MRVSILIISIINNRILPYNLQTLIFNTVQDYIDILKSIGLQVTEIEQDPKVRVLRDEPGIKM